VSTMLNGVTNSTYVPGQCAARGTSPAADEPPTHTEGADRPDAVVLSPAAQEQLRPSESAPIRDQLVERVRAQIAAGDYLTDDKIDTAIERLHDEISAVA
jgi:anti-sigma28 factor (negative regulator of flagellin synthesis)